VRTRRFDADAIVVATGLPRSGTSLLMQMLAAAGVPVLVDDARPPDASNPRGYFEYAPVRAIARDASFLPRARGKAVKVVAPLLAHLPAGERYVVLWIERDLDEVLASQAAMLARAGSATSHEADPQLRAAFARSLERARSELAQRAIEVCTVRHADAVCRPGQVADAICAFLGGPLDPAAAAASVDPGLHRVRAASLR